MTVKFVALPDSLKIFQKKEKCEIMFINLNSDNISALRMYDTILINRNFKGFGSFFRFEADSS